MARDLPGAARGGGGADPVRGNGREAHAEFPAEEERYQIKYKSLYKVHQRVAKDFRADASCSPATPRT